jgi:hypothetical protein
MMTFFARRKRRKALVGFFFVAATVGAATWALLPDSPDRARENNDAYLQHIAHILCEFQHRRGRSPVSIDEALKDSGQTLPNRGDFYGHDLAYIPASNSAFFLRAPNVELYFTDCRRVSRTDFIEWVRSHADGKADPELWLESYGF